MTSTRRTYSSEFKHEAVALAQTSGKTLTELERELGVSHGLLKQWVRKARQEGTSAFPGHGRLKPEEEELRHPGQAQTAPAPLYH